MGSHFWQQAKGPFRTPFRKHRFKSTCELFWQAPKSTRKLNTHPKTRVTDRSQNLRFRVYCIFGCALAPSYRWGTKSTRKRNTPENADSGNGHLPAFSGALRFRGAVLFSSELRFPCFFVIIQTWNGICSNFACAIHQETLPLLPYLAQKEAMKHPPPPPPPPPPMAGTL